MTAAGVTRTAAALVILAGATTATAAVARLPDPLGQYVSEAGIPGAATADLYLVGLLLVAAGVGLLAAALARLPWLVWGPLLVAVPMTVTSGLVPCTAGCPLPPYEQTTAVDLVHAGASILAVVATLATMLALVFLGDQPALRRAAAIGLLVALPQAVALLAGMLVIGRDPLTAALERTLLVSLAGWMLWTAGRSAPRNPAPPAPVRTLAAAGAAGNEYFPKGRS
ncbi:DUF998 domain-containing protein [Natronosporangium hydrolyticum]|uniref:DUF998 domain-containing protein n=1 Tax=Natronosporangium hydrolyticum TaxID=2811111 RepID=A0A895YMY3_9ACTN|nr:DUF998 domain-containing protein [Natronosporangium hydrolyticum]QSB16663.1 DUF998 domain-containing protein [Natronosporangium hydrolyticum]